MHYLVLKLFHKMYLNGCPRSGELRTEKLKSHLLRTQSLKVLPLKPGVGQYIALHATLTARDFFLAYFYSSASFTCIFFQNLSWVFCVFCVGPQNKIGHPAGGRFLYWVPENINRLKTNKQKTKQTTTKQKNKNMICGMMTCEMTNLEIEWSLCSALM